MNPAVPKDLEQVIQAAVGMQRPGQSKTKGASSCLFSGIGKVRGWQTEHSAHAGQIRGIPPSGWGVADVPFLPMTTMIGDFAPIMSASPCAFKEETMRNYLRLGVIVVVILAGATPAARGQGYGTDTQNVLMPASGGMAGVSLALPQDVPSAIFGNPATLSQFLGTQVSFGGGWVEGYPTVTRFGLRDPNDNFSATSRTEGFAGPGVGVTQDLRSLGVPGAFGLGFSGTSGLGAEFRGQAPLGAL